MLYSRHIMQKFTYLYFKKKNRDSKTQCVMTQAKQHSEAYSTCVCLWGMVPYHGKNAQRTLLLHTVHDLSIPCEVFVPFLRCFRFTPLPY